MPEENKNVVHFPDLCLSVVVKPHPNGYDVDYSIYKLCTDGSIKDESIDDNKPDLSGHVKWDGCSNWHMNNGCYHACNRQHLVNVGEIMARCWDMTKEYCPKWDGDD